MKLELKAIEHSASLSEETYAYSAKLYVDGKPFASVSNHGQGGCDSVHLLAPFTQADLRTLEAKIAKEFPPLDMSDFGMPPSPASLETWCHEQVTDKLIRADLKKALRKAILFTKDDGKVYEIKPKGLRGSIPSDKVGKYADLVKERHGPSTLVLNVMPFEKALEIYRLHA